MAMNVYEGGTITIKADTTQAKKELLEVSKILDELEKNQTKLDPKFNFNDIKKDVDKLGQYIEGRFGALDFSKVYTNLMRQAQGNPNAFAKNLERTMRGFNLLEQAVKPEDISKLAAASAQEINELINGLGGLAPTTKATGSPVIKRLQALYNKYPNGIEGLGGSGKGGGFGASEEALNRIGDTLERIDTNVQNISESIRNGTGTLKDASQSAKEYAGNMEKAETAANKMQTAVDKMKQKQQNVKNALEGEKVEADWDWSLQYLNGAKTSTSKKTPKPETPTPESQSKIKVSVPDTSSINYIIEAENELQNAIKNTNQTFVEQEKINSDLSSSNITNNLQQLSESQKELGENVRTTTEQLQEQNQVLQEIDTPSVAKKYELKELISRAGDSDNIRQNVYTIDEAEEKLKKIKNKHAEKKDEGKQLDPEEVQEVWAAINSLDQLSIYSTDEEAEQISQIFDQYEEWTEQYLSQNFGKISYDNFASLFEKLSKYREAFSKTDNLEQLRDLYNLDAEQKKLIMIPDNTINGYTYALDRIKLILDTMDQYKAAIEDAQAKGKEITEADQKFLENYDQTRNQWIKAGDRAQKNIEPLQEQKRLEEERRKKIEQEKQDEKERRIFKRQQQKEDRQKRIEENQKFETNFEDYDIKNIEGLQLEEIDSQIAQIEEYQNKALGLKNELKELEEKVGKKFAGEHLYEEEELTLMSPTDQEIQWLNGYKERMERIKKYFEELKKQKVKIRKEEEAKAKAESEKKEDIETQNVSEKDVEQAQNNADKAQEAANKAKKAADESEEAVKKTEEAKKKTEKKENSTKDNVVEESTNANQTAQNNAKNVNETKDSLEANLKMLNTALDNFKKRKEQVEKELNIFKKIQNKEFSTDSVKFDAEAAGKTVEDYVADKIKENTESLERIKTNIENKENEIKEVSDKINQVNELEQQTLGEETQDKTKKRGKGAKLKKKILMPDKKQEQGLTDSHIEAQVENEKKNGEKVEELSDQVTDNNKKLEDAKTATDEEDSLIDQIFNHSNNENNADNGGDGSKQELDWVNKLIDSIKDLPSATQALDQFDQVNSRIAKNAQGAAEAIQAEADAFSSMTQVSQGINGGQLIASDKKNGGSPIIEDSQSTRENAENELKQVQTVEQQIKAKIESIREGVHLLEHELQEYSLEDSRFDVGTNKTEAFSQAKQFADQLKQDYEALSAVDKTANPTEYETKMEQYIKSRMAFSKAYEKMLEVGYPSKKDKGTKKNPISPVAEMAELYKQHGAGSQGYNEDLREFENMAQEMRTQFEQYKANAEQTIQLLEQERIKAGLEQKGSSTPSQTNTSLNVNNPSIDKPDLGGGQSANGIRAEGDEAGNAVANMQALAKAKQEVTEANQKLAQSAQNTTSALNDEGGAGVNAGEVFNPKPLQDQIDAQKKALEEQKNTIAELKKANEDLTKTQTQATNEQLKNLQRKNEAYEKAQQTELQQRREAEFNAAIAADLQRRQFEEDERIRKEQEAKAAQKAEERAKKAEENAHIKAEDKDFSKLYTAYGNDFSAVLDAKSIQEFDAAVAHLTETERQFWEARMLQAGGTSYAYNADILKQNDLPEGYEKSADTQTTVLKQREMAVAEYTASVIAELEKQEAAFEKMDVLYQVDAEHPANGHASFIQNSLVDEEQTRAYVVAIEEVTESLQRMREIAQSMKDGTFDFGNIDALRELFELRQNLDTQVSTTKEIDKAYKGAQGQIEAKSIEKAEQYQTVLSGLEKQIEKIQTASKTLINPDSEYKTELESAKELLATIQIMIEELNANPLQFMGKDGDKNAKVIQSTIDGFKEGIGQFQEDFQSQTGIQGRINTFFTSYKGAYTSFFREIKDSFKSQALGELQKEIDQTFKTFEDSINNLNRATGLNQGEFLNKYLNTNGGKATAGQIEQQQKIRNAIAESYRGLITDISDELTKTEDRMSEVFGEKFLDQDYFQNFDKTFTAGLGDATKFKDFQNNAESVVQSLNKLKDIQEQMASGQLDLTQLAPDKLKEQIQEIVELFANLNEKYKDVIDSAKDFTFANEGDIEKQRAGITQFLKNNQGISSRAKTELQEYFNQLQQGISQADLTKLTDGWHQVADAEQAAGRTGSTFLSELQTRFKSLSAYLLSFVSFYRIIGVFKDGINIIHQLDDALTEMQKVSDESLSSLREYQKSTFDTANQIGTTAQQLQQSTADWMRLGEDLQTASQSAQTANVLFNVSEFDNINEATTALVAMSAAYADAEKGIDKIDIVDRLNLIGNNYAIATDELATALQDGAAALQTAGNDLDEAIALTTAGNEKIA